MLQTCSALSKPVVDIQQLQWQLGQKCKLRAFQVMEREVQQLKALETAWYGAQKLVQGKVKIGQDLHFYIFWYGA
ncbi:hypothetical protein Q3G72_024185 [Acer saccharum]|nr:hypothetical protein Q3G72_024185 [Acer saccharum]